MTELRKGALSPDVLCAQAGGAEWKPLREIFPDAIPAAQPVLRLRTTPTVPPMPIASTPLAPAPAASAAPQSRQMPAEEPAEMATPNKSDAADASLRATKPRRSPGRLAFDMVKLALVASAGVLTSVMLAWVLATIELRTGVSVHSLTLWFVLPVGAGLSGMGAATGCYFASRLLHYYPRLLFFLVCIGLAVGSFAYINYLVWMQTVVDGVPLSRMVGFGEYMNYISHHTDIATKFNRNKAIELGEGASMAYFVIQILGFMFGGLCVYGKLTSRPYCHESHRYMRLLHVFELYERQLDTMDRRVQGIKNLLRQGRHRDAIAQHPLRESQAKRGHTEGARSVITIYKAKKSPRATLRHQVFTCSRKDDWNEVDSLTEDYQVADF